MATYNTYQSQSFLEKYTIDNLHRELSQEGYDGRINLYISDDPFGGKIVRATFSDKQGNDTSATIVVGGDFIKENNEFDAVVEKLYPRLKDELLYQLREYEYVRLANRAIQSIAVSLGVTDKIYAYDDNQTFTYSIDYT